MADPMNIQGLERLLPTPGATPGVKPPVGAGETKDFKSLLMDSLEKVNQLQQEADAGVQRLATGETDNMAEVFSAVRKADVAFSLLMEIRNKLTDAYQEIQQMRM